MHTYIDSYIQNTYMHIDFVDRDGVVAVATRHRLDCPVIEPQYGRDFPHPYRPIQRPTQPPVQ